MTYPTADSFRSHCYMHSMAHQGAPSAVWQESSDVIDRLSVHCFELHNQYDFSARQTDRHRPLTRNAIARKMVRQEYGSIALILTWLPWVLSAFQVVFWVIDQWNKGAR